MSKTDSYCQFPLCALTYQRSVEARCEFIIAYSICETGFALWGKLPDEAKEEKMSLLESMEDVPEDFDWESEKHLAVMYAIYILEITVWSVVALLKKHAQLKEHLAAYESRHRKDATVRVKSALLFEVRDKKGMNYRELAVFCAILSVIGDKSYPVLITFRMIQRRSFGYKTAEAMEWDKTNCLIAETPELSMLTTKRVRITVEKLHELGWFARCTYGKRQTYYSTRMSDEELRNKVVTLKTRRVTFNAEKARKDNDLTAKVKAARLEIKNGFKKLQVAGTLRVY